MDFVSAYVSQNIKMHWEYAKAIIVRVKVKDKT